MTLVRCKLVGNKTSFRLFSAPSRSLSQFHCLLLHFLSFRGSEMRKYVVVNSIRETLYHLGYFDTSVN